MPDNIHLIINDIFCIISAIILAGASIFTYLNGRRNITNIMASLALLLAVVFFISHTIGVSVSDHNISRDILLFNLCLFPAGVFYMHTVISLTGRSRQNRLVLWFMYIAGLSCVAFFLVFPDLFLLPSVPKMYFPNYYNPGILNWTRIAFFVGIVFLYDLYLLISAYYRSNNLIERNQYKYFTWAMVGIYVVIFIPNFLVYNIPIDPLWGGLAGVVFIIFFLYGAVKYELLNIRVIAKQAFFFAIAIAAVGGIITLFNYSNVWIQQSMPTFPLWISAFISAVLTVTLSIIIWQKLRENDILKYEFITVIAHKFRTPLTESKWATGELLLAEKDPEKLIDLKQIQKSNEKLVNLTSMLVDLADADKPTGSIYKLERASLLDMVKEAADPFISRFKEKGISFSVEYPVLDIVANIDRDRMIFVIQTLLENSWNYTPNGGKVTLTMNKSRRKAMISVIDTGIGIKHEELPRIFSRFYRTKTAQSADTEGFGIGLSLTRSIVNRHGGKIEVFSDGEDKGSTFTVVLPIV